jgi:hypothetical protein
MYQEGWNIQIVNPSAFPEISDPNFECSSEYDEEEESENSMDERQNRKE